MLLFLLVLLVAIVATIVQASNRPVLTSGQYKNIHDNFEKLNNTQITEHEYQLLAYFFHRKGDQMTDGEFVQFLDLLQSCYLTGGFYELTAAFISKQLESRFIDGIGRFKSFTPIDNLFILIRHHHAKLEPIELVGEKLTLHGDRVKLNEGVFEKESWNALSYAANLTQFFSDITFINWQFTEEEARIVGRCFKSHITDLSIINCSFMAESCPYWSFGSLNQLKNLTFTKSNLSKDLARLLNTLPYCSTLKKLTINNIKVPNDFCKQLGVANWSKLFPNLDTVLFEGLNLGEGGIGEECVSFIRTVMSIPSVTDLSLSDNQNLWPLFKRAVQSGTLNSPLIALGLDGTGIGGEEEKDLDSFWSLFSNPMKKLWSLSIAKNPISFKVVEKLLSYPVGKLPLGYLGFYRPGLSLVLSEEMYQQLAAHELTLFTGEDVNGMIEITDMKHLNWLSTASLKKCTPCLLPKTTRLTNVVALAIFKTSGERLWSQEEMNRIFDCIPSIRTLYFYDESHMRDAGAIPFCKGIIEYSRLFLRNRWYDGPAEQFRENLLLAPNLKRLTMFNPGGNDYQELKQLFRAENELEPLPIEEFICDQIISYPLVFAIKEGQLCFPYLRLAYFKIQLPQDWTFFPYYTHLSQPNELKIKELILDLMPSGHAMWHMAMIDIFMVNCPFLKTLFIRGHFDSSGFRLITIYGRNIRTLVIEGYRNTDDTRTPITKLSKLVSLSTLILGPLLPNSFEFTIEPITDGFPRLVELYLPPGKKLLHCWVNSLPLAKMKYFKRLYHEGKIYSKEELLKAIGMNCSFENGSGGGSIDSNPEHPITRFFKGSSFNGLIDLRLPFSWGN